MTILTPEQILDTLFDMYNESGVWNNGNAINLITEQLALREPQWRPIDENMPRDGTQFLVWTQRVGLAVVTHDSNDEYSVTNEFNPYGLSLYVDDGKHGPFPLRGDYPKLYQLIKPPTEGTSK